MNRQSYIDSCFSPIPLRRDGGFTQYVHCNTCESCRQRLADKWSRRLEDDMLSGKYYYKFVTLTYNNENLPFVEYDDDFENFKLSFTQLDRLTGKNKRVRRNLDSVDLRKFLGITDLDDSVNSVPLDDSIIPHFVSSAYGDNKQYDKKNRFAVVFKEDVQKFIKRLRNYLSGKFKGTEVDYGLRFYVCSEYGPRTYRPHYHILLAFSSRVCWQSIDAERILNIWNKQDFPTDPGRLSEICKPVQNIHASAKYISGYLVKCIDLPRVLQYPDFKTFHSSSTRVPFGSEAVDISAFSSSLEKDGPTRTISYYDVQESCFVTNKRTFNGSFTNRYFPKFVGHSNLSSDVLREIFRLIYSYYKQGKELPDLRSTFASIFPNYSGIRDYLIIKKYRCVYDFCSSPFGGVYSYLKHVKYFKTILPVSIKDKFTSAQSVSKLLSTGLRVGSRRFDIFIHLYLFGIPRNLSICRRIYKNIADNDILKSYFSYYDLYNKYWLKLFVYKYTNLVEFCNNYISQSGAEKFLPSLFSLVYSGNVPLVDNIQNLSLDEYDLFYNRLLSFGLCPEMFYDVGGNLIKFDNRKLFSYYFTERINSLIKYRTLRYSSKYYSI